MKATVVPNLTHFGRDAAGRIPFRAVCCGLLWYGIKY